MPQHDAALLRKRVREIVGEALADVAVPVSVNDFGPCLRLRLPGEEQARLLEYEGALLDELFTNEVREQTKGGTGDSDQIEFFPMDTWIASAQQGKRVRYRHATWKDHVAHRENQITNVRRVTRSFDVEEGRREKLRSVGMEEDETMTTEQALACLEDVA